MSPLPRVPSPLLRRVALAVMLSALTGCATVRKAVPAPPAGHVPVLLVHGIDDSPAAFQPMRDRLREAGWPVEQVAAVRLTPNNGQLPIEALAMQVARAAEGLRRRTGAERIDVVAFSMGALISRYWLQEVGGHQKVRRFLSISGPHHGTRMAYIRRGPAILQMRPGSELLQRLERRNNPFGDTELYTFWTPLDVTVYPAESARLPGATERTFPVILHPLMLSDPNVLDAVVETLSQAPRAQAASTP